MNLKIKAIIFFFAIIMIVGFVKPMLLDLTKFDISGIVIGGLSFLVVTSWYEKKKKVVS